PGDGPETGGTSVTDLGQVLDVYGTAVSGVHHDVPNVPKILDQPLGPDKIGLVHTFDIPAPGHAVVFLQGGEDLLGRDVHGFELLGLQGHFVLFEVAAPRVHLHHPRNSGTLPFDHPILDAPQIHGTVAVLVAGTYIQDVLVDFAQASGDRPHFGGPEAFGDLLGGRNDLLGDQLPGEIGAHMVL